MQEEWRNVLQWYKDNLNIPEKLVELAADYDVVQLSSTGAANSIIADLLEMDLKDIVFVLNNRVSKSFSGWESSLNFNPNNILMEILETSKNGILPIDDSDMELYEQKVVSISNQDVAEQSFMVARIAILMDVELSFYFP